MDNSQMDSRQQLTSIVYKLTSLVSLVVLSACGGSYNQNPIKARVAADAYLTTSTLTGKAAVAPSTSATLSTGTSASSGLYAPMAVTLSCADASGAGCLATYYTVDGTTPSRASTAYSGPITIWSKTTIKYFSIDKAGNTESVKTQNFLIGSIAMQGIKSIAAGWNHTLGLKNDGTLWAWGDNASGQLGVGSLLSQSKPVKIGTGTTWSTVATGKAFTLALKTDGSLWTWGLNSSGQLGDGTLVNKAAPVRIGNGTTWSAISAGDSFALALKADGTLWAWGANLKGQLGIGTAIDSNVPVQVGIGTTWTAIAAGYDHAVALRNDGTLWTWGGNYSGQLGQGTITASATPGSLVPLQVPGSNWSAVAAGGSSRAYANEFNLNAVVIDPTWVGGHTVALKSDGTLWAWGQNIYGQLGDGTSINMGWAGSGAHPLTGFSTFDAKLPIKIGTDVDWASISAGGGHTVAIKTDGTLWAWGLNVNGQLSNGNPGMDNLLPLPVGADTYLPYILPKQPWTSAVAGGSQTFALRNDGTLWAWGWNASGQLGDGTTISSGGGSDPLTPTWKKPKFSYVVSGKVYSYTIDYDPGSGSGPNTGSGQLTATGLPAVAAGTAPVAAALDPAGNYLYVVDSAIATVGGEKVSYIHTFAVNHLTGGLTEVGDPAGVKTLVPVTDAAGNFTEPQSIMVDPLGKFVYVVGVHSKGWRTVAVYTINPATGEITCVGTGGKGAKSMVVEPLGRFAYVVRDVGVADYSIDQRTGMLSSLTKPCPYDSCDDNEDNADVPMSGVKSLKVDLSGQFLYLSTSGGSATSCDVWGVCTTTGYGSVIRAYSINRSTGLVYDTGFAQGDAGIGSLLAISPGVGVDAHTQFMYYLYNNTLKGLQLNQITGQVTFVGIDPTNGLGAYPDPTGKLIYVLNQGSVLGYAIDPFSGKTQVIGLQTNPTQMATDAAPGGLKTMLFASY